MELREETLTIFKKSFGTESAYKVLEFIESRIQDDVATQRDIYELKLEIEKVRAEIEKVRADLHTGIERVRSELRSEIEKNRLEIEKVRAETQKSHASLLKWSFGFWFSQVALLTGILFKLLS